MENLEGQEEFDRIMEEMGITISESDDLDGFGDLFKDWLEEEERIIEENSYIKGNLKRRNV